MITCYLTGNVGRDATLKALEGGRNVINFSVGVQVGYKDKAKTVWCECSYFTERTGITPYLLKGTKVLVVGQPDIRTYAKQDGSTGASLTILVREVELLGGKSESAAKEAFVNQPATQPTVTQDANNITEPIDDLPF